MDFNLVGNLRRDQLHTSVAPKVRVTGSTLSYPVSTENETNTTKLVKAKYHRTSIGLNIKRLQITSLPSLPHSSSKKKKKREKEQTLGI